MKCACCVVITLLLSGPFCSFAQIRDTAKRPVILLDSVIVDAEGVSNKSAFLDLDGGNVRSLQTAINLSDALARLPGFSQITTGGAISKPVLHGMYGNRLLVLVNGLKYDAQQWQDEHGLGLSQIGVRTVTAYSQAESAEYGAEAVGGVIEVEDERALKGEKSRDATVRLHSNTYGTLSDAGLSDGTHRILWNVRGGFENHADYTDGEGNRILNSRNKGYYLKAGAGFEKKNWKQYNYYNFSYNQFGFIIPDLLQLFTPDDRQSRAMSGPHHNVMLHFFNSQNEFHLRKSTLLVTAGLQSNRRSEDEGGGAISLDLHLLSFLQNAVWKRELLWNGLRLELRENLLYQTNKNLGPRLLIPDAHVFEGNVAAKLAYEQPASRFFAEATLGINDRNINTFLTGYINGPGKEAQPFSINRPVVNGAFIAGFKKEDDYRLSYQFSTGSRSANLAELSSDGLHEGSYQYEIGRSDLKTEQNFSDKISGRLNKKFGGIGFETEASAYYNVFRDYIFLSPTAEARFGYPVFRYTQQNAGIGGIDASYLLSFARRAFQLQQSYSVVEGILSDGEHLPFMPPARLTTSLQYNLSYQRRTRLSDVFISPQLQYSFAQNKPATNEVAVADYALVHVNAGLSLNASKKTSYVFTLGIRNLLDKEYADFLSRIRYYGLSNQGRNVVLSVTMRGKW